MYRQIIHFYLIQFPGMLHCWLQRLYAMIRTFGTPLVHSNNSLTYKQGWGTRDVIYTCFIEGISILEIVLIWTHFCPTLFCYIINHLVSNFCQNKSVLQRLISSAASSLSQLPTTSRRIRKKTFSHFEVISNFIFI